MTAKRMAEGGPRSQPPPTLNSTFPPTSSHNRTFPSPDPHISSQAHNEQQPVPSGSGSGVQEATNHPGQRSTAPIPPAPADKGLSVQELKALTRRRLARQFGGSTVPPINTNTNTNTKPPTGASNRNSFHPSMTYPPMDTPVSPDKKSIEDYALPSHHHQQQEPHENLSFLHSLHGGLKTRSGSTSPTVDSCSTGSDGGEYGIQHPLQQQQPPPSYLSRFAFIQRPPILTTVSSQQPL